MRWRDATIAELAAALSAPGPNPAGGVAAAAACSFAAALVVLAVGPSDPSGTRASELSERAIRLLDQDAAGYEQLAAAVRAEGTSGAELQRAREAASATPLEVAEIAAELVQLARSAEAQSPAARRGDAVVAGELARAACAAAAALVEVNLNGAASHHKVARARELVAIAGNA